MDDVREEMVLHLASVQMHAEQTVELMVHNKFSIGDVREDVAVMERLRDTSCDLLKKRYEDKIGLEELSEAAQAESLKDSDKWMRTFGITDYDKRVKVPDFINRCDILLNKQKTETISVVNILLELWFRA